MKGNKIKKVLWVLIFALLSMPLIQYNLNLFTLLGLKGNYEQAPDVSITKEGWWQGTYQEQKNKYINDNVGFRPDLVRISNQIDFSVFNIARGALKGKDDYLLYSEYVNTSTGGDFLGTDVIREHVLKMKYLQDVFRKANKTFLFVEPISKTDFMPEIVYGFPAADKIGPTNRKAYKYYCDSLGVNHMDVGAYLQPLKGKIKPAIFTKQGIHWSLYGAMYAVDSIIKFIEHDRNIDLVNPVWDTYTETDIARKTDDDIGQTLNLIFPIKETFYYPEIKFPADTVRNKPSAIYIGDSFSWTVISDSLMDHTHSNWEFWYYFNTVHTAKTINGEQATISIPEYNWKGKLDSADCVILLYVSQNFHEMNRFIDSAYNYYRGKEQAK